MAFDWITEFMNLTEGIRSPPSFRLWTAIATIGMVLERHVWTETDVKPLYPNLYIVLAGVPASGKTIMVNFSREVMGPLIRPDNTGIWLAPDNPTSASFMDVLKDAERPVINGHACHAPMAVLCTELGDLISKYDKDFAAKLTTLFDNPDNYSMPRRTSKSIVVEAPTINLLAAATPAALGDTIPESAWDQGLTSRMIFIYGSIPEIRRRIFHKPQQVNREILQNKLVEFFEELHGEFFWEVQAQDAMEYWFNDLRMAPVPKYERLSSYRGRRDTHIMKLSMISAVSAGRGLIVTLKDFRRAQYWLFNAEKTMPSVFRAMAQKSDSQLLQDCHYHFYSTYYKLNPEMRKPIKDRDVWEWFSKRVPHDKISSLIEAMKKTGRLVDAGFAGDWVPGNLNDMDPADSGETEDEGPTDDETPEQ